MKETTRTIILFIVLGSLVAYMIWVNNRNDSSLQSINTTQTLKPSILS